MSNSEMIQRSARHTRLAEIVRWRDENRTAADDTLTNQEHKDFKQGDTKVKWKSKRVDSLIIAERSSKIRQRLKTHDRMLDQEVQYLNHLQFRAVREVEHQMEKVKLELSQVQARTSVPLDKLRIPSYKITKPRVVQTGAAAGRAEGREDKVKGESRARRPSTAIGIRLDRVGNNWGGSDEKINHLRPTPHLPPRHKRGVFGGDVYDESPSSASCASVASPDDGCPAGQKAGRMRPLRPSTATGVRMMGKKESAGRRRPRSAWEDQAGREALEEYRRKHLRWKHSFKA